MEGVQVLEDVYLWEGEGEGGRGGLEDYQFEFWVHLSFVVEILTMAVCESEDVCLQTIFKPSPDIFSRLVNNG